MKQHASASTIDAPPSELSGALELLRQAATPTPEELAEVEREALRLVAASAASVAEGSPFAGTRASRAEPSAMEGGGLAAAVTTPRSLWRLAVVRGKVWMGAGALAVFGVGQWSPRAEPPPLPPIPAVLTRSEPLAPLEIPPVEVVSRPARDVAKSEKLPTRIEPIHGAARRRVAERSSSPASFLQQAEAALRRNQPGQALAFLQRVPLSPLTKEGVDFLELIAHCKLGRNVRGLRARFLTTWRRSSYKARLESECPE